MNLFGVYMQIYFMKSTVMLPLSFGCVTHLYTLFIAHHRKESTRVRRNKDAISAKARFI